MIKNVARGEIYLADMTGVVGSEQGGVRPVIIIQNDVGNKYSPTTIVACVTSKTSKSKIPTHVNSRNRKTGVEQVFLMEQIRTIDKQRLIKYLDVVDRSVFDQALRISLDLI